MCSAPVTFGGGIAIEKFSSGVPSGSGWCRARRRASAATIRGSTSAGSKRVRSWRPVTRGGSRSVMSVAAEAAEVDLAHDREQIAALLRPTCRCGGTRTRRPRRRAVVRRSGRPADARRSAGPCGTRAAAGTRRTLVSRTGLGTCWEPRARLAARRAASVVLGPCARRSCGRSARSRTTTDPEYTVVVVLDAGVGHTARSSRGTVATLLSATRAELAARGRAPRASGAACASSSRRSALDRRR